MPLLRVEAYDSVQPAGVQKNCVGSELLTTHSVPSARDADRAAFGASLADDRLDAFDGIGADYSVDTRLVETEVNIIDDYPAGRRRHH
jgi:hypothetical protein